MTRQFVIGATLAVVLGLGLANAQSQTPAKGGADVLAAVRITGSVLADGKPLPPGTYEIRLTDEYLKPNPGQSPDAARWVEFVNRGQVVAREVATVLTPDASAPVGTSYRSGPKDARVEMLKGGEFLRVSATRDGKRYLIHLPMRQ